MIKRLETAEEIAKLLVVEDDIERHRPCSRGEWVQWLVSQAENSRIGIWADVANGKIESYVVAANMVSPPLTRHVLIIYAWSKMPLERSKKLLEQIKEWAKAVGASSVRTAVSSSENVSNYKLRYSFKEVGTVLELEV